MTAHGIRLRIHLQPRAAYNRVVGSHGDALKISLTAPPVDGAANTALSRFLASQLNISASAVILLGGEKSRDKHILIRTESGNQLVQRLIELLRRVDKKKRDD
ncbi:MAG: hypothetical protein FJ147_18425 [Deltaproteobacteria bacterium]|nr:hypothetical protein [Deltaproteobacteria bacterium]